MSSVSLIDQKKFSMHLLSELNRFRLTKVKTEKQLGYVFRLTESPNL